MTKGYYIKKLAGKRLQKCYEIASPRIQQYLEAEIQFVLEHVNTTHQVLEIGCGYGRVLARLATKADQVYGIDTSQESLRYAQFFLQQSPNIHLFNMNARSLNFKEQAFDVTIAIQNAISAFKIDPFELISHCVKVTKCNGKVLLSSYSEKIWDARLDWFIQQANEGLLGDIDLEKTGKGIIVGKDGFKATTFSQRDFNDLITKMDLDSEIIEIDESSIFCVITSK
ncbi:MAG: methyltransferase domain-containing protein [Candidatus Heimdallarchaeota archaeon]|nr:methyltransferase domain-containing protein [Candidatus Heimdallarchaeota archaeon]